MFIQEPVGLSCQIVASRSLERRARFAFASACSAELLSDTAKDFVGESRILYGAGQYYATDQRRCLKDGLFPVPTAR
jgi:hypothetical protein